MPVEAIEAITRTSSPVDSDAYETALDRLASITRMRTNTSPEDKTSTASSNSSSSSDPNTDERRAVELQKRDHAVRLHEQAHLAVAGQYARGGAKFEYETGPDRKRYAVGGEVQLDASEIPDDPKGTAKKMQQIRQAALAPADPSPQDYRVAADAVEIEARAVRQTLMDTTSTKSTEEGTSSSKGYSSTEDTTPGQHLNQLA